MAVMQILTGENWNSIMFQVMTDVHPAAALYFLVVNCFGVYVPRKFESRSRDAHVIMHRFLLLNLFVAALTDGLSQADGDMIEFNDKDETPTVREPNFFAPGQLLRAYFLHLSLPMCEACRSRVRYFEL